MNGIIYIVFSKEYERFAVDCLKISRQHTKHPFLILHNLKGLSAKWKLIKDVDFKYFDLPDNENRHIKTSAIYHTPFKNSLLLDCDTVIQKEINFGFLQGADVVLNEFLRWNKGDKILRIYKRAFEQFNVSLPVSIYNGAFVMFRNTGKIKEFFNLWHRYWIDFGKKREMPCLTSAVYNLNLNIRKLPNNYLGLDKMIKGATIQHRNQYFKQVYGIEPLTKINSYVEKGDWSWVHYD